MSVHPENVAMEKDSENQQIQGPTLPKDGNSRGNKRIKLTDEFEYVSLDTKTNAYLSTSVDTSVKFEDLPAASSIQSKISIMDIKDEPNDLYETNAVDSKEFMVDNLITSSSVAEVDPLIPDESAYQCEECDYSTATNEDLEDHMQSCHKKQRIPEKLQCSECEYSTYKKATLQNHRKHKHPKRKYRKKCSKCDFMTYIKSDLLEHVKNEHCKENTIRKLSEEEEVTTEVDDLSKDDSTKTENSMEAAGIETDIDSEIQNENVCETSSLEISTVNGNRAFENSKSLNEGCQINKVDALLTKDFTQLSLDEQLELKRLGPHKPECIEIQQSDSKQNRSFSKKWFDRVDWLTVSESQKTFYCFYCLLFGGEVTWSKTGYKSLKHLSEKIKLHESTALHINNAVKFKTFGVNVTTQLNEDTSNSIQHHNELVEKYRRMLAIIVDSIKFCLSQDIPLPEEEDCTCMFNRKVFLGLVELVESFDNTTYEHPNSSTITDYTSEAVQNELIDCMHHIYREELKKDLEKANFVSVHVEGISNAIFDNYHFAIIIRYVKDYNATERLHSFIEVPDQTASGLALAIHTELAPYNLRHKVIAQTYDGFVTRGPFSGIQNCMKQYFPHALFVHSYAHSFDRILNKACSSILSVRLFFAGVEGFAEYFSLPNRMVEVLKSECEKIPSSTENKWDTVFDSVKTIYHNQSALSASFERIEEECGWSSMSVVKAIQYSDLLHDKEFLFFLTFFYKILHHVDALSRAFHSRVSCGDIMATLKNFETTIMDMAEVLARTGTQFKTVVNEVCGIIVTEIRERFEATDHLVSFTVVNPNNFGNSQKFLSDHIEVLVCRYRMLLQGKLTNELKVLYSNKAFASAKSVSALLKLVTENELQGTFTELCKLIEIVLATPASACSSSKISTSEKLQNFFKTELLPDKLHIFATFKIHRDAIDNMRDFNNHVTDYFAKKTQERGHFLYKT